MGLPFGRYFFSIGDGTRGCRPDWRSSLRGNTAAAQAGANLFVGAHARGAGTSRLHGERLIPPFSCGLPYFNGALQH